MFFKDKLIIRSFLIILLITVVGCIAIPQETVSLSAAIGKDLREFKSSHEKMITLYYDKELSNIDKFIEEIYTPYIINYTIKVEMEEFESGNESLFGLMREAAENNSGKVSKDLLEYMQDYLQAAQNQIENKRISMTKPILEERSSLILSVNRSYDNAINGNAALTAHLKSIRKIKNAQSEALEMFHLNNIDSLISTTLVKTSEGIRKVLQKAKEIDVKSDDALKKINTISDEYNKIFKK
ncbi:MAG: hypothetical protein Q7T79_03290 [bacterium]|nr:hypothetical protein [bacterium]